MKMERDKIIIIDIILGTVGYALIILSLYLPWYYRKFHDSFLGIPNYYRYFYIDDAQNFIEYIFNFLLFGAIFGLVIIIISALVFWKKKILIFTTLTILAILLLVPLVHNTLLLEFEGCQTGLPSIGVQCIAYGYSIGFYINLLAILILTSNLLLLFIGFLKFRNDHYYISN